MKNNSAGVVGGPLLVKRFGALTPPPYIRRCCGAERVKKSNERSGAVSGVQKTSGAWAEREREVVGAGTERWVGLP